MNGGGAVGGGDTRGDTDTDTDNDKNVVIFLGPETEQTGRWAQDTTRAVMRIEIVDTNHFCTYFEYIILCQRASTILFCVFISG